MRPARRNFALSGEVHPGRILLHALRRGNSNDHAPTPQVHVRTPRSGTARPQCAARATQRPDRRSQATSRIRCRRQPRTGRTCAAQAHDECRGEKAHRGSPAKAMGGSSPDVEGNGSGRGEEICRRASAGEAPDERCRTESDRRCRPQAVGGIPKSGKGLVQGRPDGDKEGARRSGRKARKGAVRIRRDRGRCFGIKNRAQTLAPELPAGRFERASSRYGALRWTSVGRGLSRQAPG